MVRATDEGLQLTLEEMRCSETIVYVPSSMFSSYYVAPDEDVKFKISIKVFTDCLHIFGEDGNPKVKMSYRGEGSSLCLVYVVKK